MEALINLTSDLKLEIKKRFQFPRPSSSLGSCSLTLRVCVVSVAKPCPFTL